ncbi:hypothetical protein NL676_038128 [Syzygium grande]|nr:hypothetical protein NL676_038128 [Syzygium grande]
MSEGCLRHRHPRKEQEITVTERKIEGRVVGSQMEAPEVIKVWELMEGLDFGEPKSEDFEPEATGTALRSREHRRKDSTQVHEPDWFFEKANTYGGKENKGNAENGSNQVEVRLRAGLTAGRLGGGKQRHVMDNRDTGTARVLTPHVGTETPSRREAAEQRHRRGGSGCYFVVGSAASSPGLRQ